MRVIILLMLSIFCLCAHSADNGRTGSQTSKSEPNEKIRGTQANPLFVQVIPSKEAEESAKVEDQYKQKKSVQDDKLTEATVILAWVTGILAAFTGGLFLITVCMAWDARKTSERQAKEVVRSLKTAEDAADAASQSAKASERTANILDTTAKADLRAYLSVTPDIIDGNCNIGSTVKNIGKTPAYKITVESGAVDILPYPLPPENCFVKKIENIKYTFSLVQSEHMRAMVNPCRKFSEKEIDAAIKGIDFRFYVYGVITYTDVFNKEHRIEYCRSVQGGDSLRKVLGKVPAMPNESISIAFEITAQHNDAT